MLTPELPIILFSGVRTWRAKGAKAPQVFRRHKKCPLSSGKVPFAFVKCQSGKVEKWQSGKVPSLQWQSALCPLPCWQVPSWLMPPPHPPQLKDASYAPDSFSWKIRITCSRLL